MIYREIKDNKENEVGMDNELHNLIIDLIQFEIEKCTFIKSSKFYFKSIGLTELYKFFNGIYYRCSSLKDSLCNYLIERDEDIPEFNIPKIDTSFESKSEPFEIFIKFEDEYFNKVNKIVERSLEVKDFCSFSFFLYMLRQHKIGKRVLNCVNENKDPNNIIDEMYTSL